MAFTHRGNFSFLGSGPEGADDLCLHTWGKFFLLGSGPEGVDDLKASRLKFQSRGPNPSLKAQVPALRPKSHLLGPNLKPGGNWALRLGFGPRGWDMGFEAEIWAWRLGGTKRKEKEKKTEKIPLCESIGHRPFLPAA